MNVNARLDEQVQTVVAAAGLLVFAFRNKVLREAGERGEDDDDEATLALLERSDEGGV